MRGRKACSAPLSDGPGHGKAVRRPETDGGCSQVSQSSELKSNRLPSFILLTITEKKTETEATVSCCLTTPRLAQI